MDMTQATVQQISQEAYRLCFQWADLTKAFTGNNLTRVSPELGIFWGAGLQNILIHGIEISGTGDTDPGGNDVQLVVPSVKIISTINANEFPGQQLTFVAGAGTESQAPEVYAIGGTYQNTFVRPLPCVDSCKLEYIDFQNPGGSTGASQLGVQFDIALVATVPDFNIFG